MSTNTETIVKKWEDSFDVDISYHEHTGHFFVNFSKGDKCLISIKVSEGEAVGVANHLNLKISK